MMTSHVSYTHSEKRQFILTAVGSSVKGARHAIDLSAPSTAHTIAQISRVSDAALFAKDTLQ